MEQKQGTPFIGTHNSMTYLRPQKWYGWFMIPFARCQRKTIEEQWYDGARCFDLRIRFTKQGEPYFAHGLYECTHEVKPIDVLVQLDRLILRYNQPAFVRLILEDPDKQNHNVFYFKRFCQGWSKANKLIHFFGGNRKGDWAQIVEFDYKPNLTQYVGSMMEDARWYEKAMPFAYAWRRNKLIHFFGGNRKGDWAQIVEFDYKPNLTQYVGSMMEDARWYEKIMPFAYAWRRNKKNKQNPQGDIAIYDFI